MRSFALALVATVVAAGAPLLAQQHPNHERGFAPEKLYQYGDIDSIALMNGNLNVTIPIGPEYRVGGKVSYRLTLVYNSKLWDIEERTWGSDVLTQALPNRRSNAGLGWQLSLGRLISDQDPTNHTDPRAWVYVSPDGAEHVLYPTLHDGETVTNGTTYTRDGTYLRLRATAGSTHELDFPDGTVHRFDSQNRLVEIRDHFGNRVQVDYGAVPGAWKIFDRWRTHYVYFTNKVMDGTVVAMVDRIELATFENKKAEYKLAYTAQSIRRPNKDVQGIERCYDNDPLTTPELSVPLLQSVTIRNRANQQEVYGTFELSYNLVDSGNACQVGTLASLRLPTRGIIEWEYVGRRLPVEGCRPEMDSHWASLTPAVQKRTLRIAPSSEPPVGVWTYGMTLSEPPLPAPGDDTCGSTGEFLPSEVAQVTVTSPLGHTTTHYFSAWPNRKDSFNGYRRQDFGLPFTRSDPAGSNLFLSQQTLDCSGQSCSLLRSEYVRYERDGAGSCNIVEPFQRCMDRNRRAAASRTIFHDDDGRYLERVLSNFDGFGHYRTITTGGNFDAGNVRVETTQYNPSPEPTDNWVLDVYSHRDVTEGGVTARIEYSFDTANGFLNCRRTLKNGVGRSGNDVLVVFSGTLGDVTKEAHYGGDKSPPLGTGSTCATGSQPAQYVLDHTYSGGELATTKYAGFAHEIVDRTIDPASGLPSSSRDIAGLQTTYRYDALGRLTEVRPQEDGWTVYTYGMAVGSTPARVSITRKGQGGSGVLASEEVIFDELGRVERERRTMADGTIAERRTFYNALGWVTSRSEWGTNAATGYDRFDPFGRPGRITPPDGAAHNILITYKGVREVTRKVKVGTTWNGTNVVESTSTTTEVYDGQGRLYRVNEPANPDGTTSTTTYGYDVGGRLAQVTQTAKELSGTQRTQTRLFTYDNRGFLIGESHPEKSGSCSAGGVTRNVCYSGYDALGNPGRKQDGPSDVTFEYDGAGRLRRVRESGSFSGTCATHWTSGPRCLKEFFYGAASNAATSGRLLESWRYNYPMLGSTTYTAVIKHAYTYGGRQGRISKRETSMTFNGSTTERFEQGWTWNPLGDLEVLSYPRCVFAPYCSAPAPREISYGYSNGLLTGVEGFATLTYHSNGQPAQVTHQLMPSDPSTWVVDTYGLDPQRMARPASIQTRRGSTTLWSTGEYSYDGMGNVTRIGNAHFVYDPVSRIKSGRLYLGPGGGGANRTFDHAYDGFGNLQSLTRNGTSLTTTTSALTNRMTGAVTYDQAGNLTSSGIAPVGLNTYTYDPLGQVVRSHHAGEAWLYMYDADDERLWAFREGASSRFDRWTLRDLDGRVLRTYETKGYVWSWAEDHIYRGTSLLASVTPDRTTHFHLDHLGTPRLVTGTVTTGASGFYTLTPCRVVDTRTEGGPLAAGETRAVQVAGTCGVPANASAVAINVTAVGANVRGEMTGYATGEPRPDTSTISYPVGNARANNAILELGAGSLSFFNDQPSGNVHLVIDVFGYFVEGSTGVGAYHVYYPFGEEATAVAQATQRLRFTGHERDLRDVTSGNDDLDYMHARFYNPQLGRFLSIDPVRSGKPSAPQSWNQYAYALGNPVGYTDPDGQDVVWFARDDAAGGATNFGHTALRVFGNGYDTVYDFGRYQGGHGFLRASGPGILRVWSDSGAFVRDQASKGNLIAAQYATTEEFDRSVMGFFDQQIAGASKVGGTASFTSYRLKQEYDLLGNNCTTICARALGAGGKSAGKKDALIKDHTGKIYSRTVDPREIFQELDSMRQTTPAGMVIYYRSYTAAKK